MSFTVDDPADVVRHLIDTNMVLANITALNANITEKPTVKKFKKLLTVDPQTVNDNFVRTSIISEENNTTDLNMDHRTSIHLIDVQIDCATDAAMTAVKKEVKRAIDVSRLIPLGSDRTYHFLEYVFGRNGSAFKTNLEQWNVTVQLSQISKPITI